ncbi:hypothetical protein [Luteimonas sp. gir]|uniref:hypothetical protein n=1 Tax=Luteimonas sp. gir TaxID=3127960 RepID=UPI003075D8F0
MHPIILRVTSFDRSRAWTDDLAHTRNMLVRMLRKSSPLSHVQAKRLVKAVLAGAETDLPLQDATLVQPMRHALQSVGTDIQLVPTSA